MRASSSQRSRLTELASKLLVPEGVIAARAGVDGLDGLSAPQAGEAIRLLLECDVLPLPADAEEGAARFARAAGAGPVERRSDSEPWHQWAAAQLGLGAPTRCVHCGGSGEVSVTLAPTVLARDLLGYRAKSGVSVDATVKLMRRRSYRLLRHVADSWFDGDLNAADRFCAELADRMVAA